MNRRTFMQSSIALMLTSGHGGRAEATHKIDRIGVQLYTVRDLMKDDFEGTIARVAQIGYREVEFAGFFDHAPKEVRATLERNGLIAPSEHVGYEVLEKKWPETLEAALIVGHSYVVCSSVPRQLQNQADGWKHIGEELNKAGEASQKAGIQFAYHNHAFEFEPSEILGGQLPYDVLLAQTDPKLVKMEMDLCWITVGGQDPLKYFERYPGRFPLVHVKDWTKKGPAGNDYGGAARQAARQGHMADVGQGEIDWKRIFAKSDRAGIEHYFVEEDQPPSPLEDLRVSYQYLAKLRF
jgi:sugar phosphate isomerase/epimerase